MTGCTNVLELYREIAAQGYRDSYGSVRDYLAPFRESRTALPPAAKPPKVRTLASWIMTHPDNPDSDDQVTLKNALADCPHLDALTGHVRGFAEMMLERQGDRLEGWMTNVDADDLPYLRSFTLGLRRDHAAILNTLTLPHSSGAVEGNVNRVKMLKRQTYGRATFAPHHVRLTGGRNDHEMWARSRIWPSLTALPSSQTSSRQA
ncbi:transposase [Spongiactinospora sp. 9N601]|uniref:transposase n=1 Tax=Spongiactinospora sp. 9N601 TaxID=3375149 RepID=UPI0037B00BB9